MMNTNSKMFQKLKDPEYRRLFIVGQIKHGFSNQVRALRKARNNMTQQKLAELAGTTQTVISRIEKNGAEKMSVQSLLNIANAFDVALVVRLEPIDKLADWVGGLSPETMTPQPSEEVLSEIERQSREQEKAIVAVARSSRNVNNTAELSPRSFGVQQTKGRLNVIEGTKQAVTGSHGRPPATTQLTLNFLHLAPKAAEEGTKGEVEFPDRARTA